MNYQKKIAYQIFLAVFLVLQIFTNGYASDASFDVDLTSGAKSVRVKGQFTRNSQVTNRKNLAFLDSISGANGLGKRISDVRLFDSSGKPVEVRRFIDGESVAASDYYAWEYTIDLTPAQNIAAAAHTSWIGPNEGILMTDDLLPQFTANGQAASGEVNVKKLTDWRSFSTDAEGDRFAIGDLRKGVIFLGTKLRSRSLTTGTAILRIIISGEWLFTDDEASQMAEEILYEHARLFGSTPANALQISVMKFPVATNPGAWEAETRGRTVTILSSDMPFRTQSLQRLHEQLRHEIFHFWIPNGVNLKGDYAWFYEGFALYQSLKMAVAINRIRFEDFLDTLSRAYSIDIRQNPRRPLIGSGPRSTGMADTQTYARGMLIAFMLDVAMLRESKGRVNITSVLQQIVRKYGSANGVDGNTAVLDEIGKPEFSKQYILGADPLNMELELASSGIVLETSGRSSALRVVAKPSGREKEILDRLGYNSWRKSLKTTK